MKIRGNDRHGSGAYKASRGRRKHNGIDVCCDAGLPVVAFCGGKVTKIGYPYSQGENRHEPETREHAKFENKKALRYVQITDCRGLDTRYFYVQASVSIGATVAPGGSIGIAQGLAHIYSGITEHFHFETLLMVNGKKVFLDPEQYLSAVKR